MLDLKVKQGDRVEEGQVIAVVGDQKLGLQIQAQSAQTQAAQAQVEQARRELERGEQLIKEGFATKARLDQLHAAYDVAINTLKSMTAQQSVAQEQQTQGKVLAPTSGRILTVPVTAGTVVMPGDTIATLAEQNYVLRLNVPERHANHIKSGDAVRVDGSELGSSSSNSEFGTIKLVYPKVENGRVQADATVKGLGDYFVGERVRVWISAGERKAIVVPSDFLITRNGIDYALVKSADWRNAQCACAAWTGCLYAGFAKWRRDPFRPEIRRSTGASMKFGLSGNLTRATITSPLTPLFLLAAIIFGLVALMVIPREEEPQISVPMVDILVSANGLKAPDAAELVTKPLEEIIKGINGVEHVYSQTQDDRVMVTARFFTGTKEDDAVLRVHEKIRANYDRIPQGIPEPLIVKRGINDVAIVVLTSVAETGSCGSLERQKPLRTCWQGSVGADQG